MSLIELDTHPAGGNLREWAVGPAAAAAVFHCSAAVLCQWGAAAAVFNGAGIAQPQQPRQPAAGTGAGAGSGDAAGRNFYFIMCYMSATNLRVEIGKADFSRFVVALKGRSAAREIASRTKAQPAEFSEIRTIDRNAFERRRYEPPYQENRIEFIRVAIGVADCQRFEVGFCVPNGVEESVHGAGRAILSVNSRARMFVRLRVVLLHLLEGAKGQKKRETHAKCCYYIIAMAPNLLSILMTPPQHPLQSPAKPAVEKGKIDKSIISGPASGSFVHVAHVGCDEDHDLASIGVDPSWTAFLSRLGVDRKTTAQTSS
ncbi:hypothetical protein B0H14DRAFT_2592417 [Mycena olivaceomarginata]|nr:hypothetical protein B0H14DRAFT_2592417 [Mycena olivaceomarginata]